MRVITFERECTQIETFTSDVIALEDSTKLCVQFSGTDLPIDIDAEIYVWASNDAENWGQPGDFASAVATGISIRNNMNSGFVPMHEVTTGCRFIKIEIIVIAEPSVDYTLKTIICIKD